MKSSGVMETGMRKLTGFELKIVAAIAMCIDHAGAVFFPDADLLRVIGRISFPLFCFLAVEGFCHTRNVYRYLTKLVICACVSELFFDLTFFGQLVLNRNNSVFTLAGGVGALLVIRRTNLLTGSIFALLAGYFLQLAGMDYGFYGVLLIVLMYLARQYGMETKQNMYLSWGMITVFMIFYKRSIQAYGAFAIIFMVLYSGERGYHSRWTKRFFYVFYPAHLAAIFVLETALSQI